ncbi:crossover junction endodeoxyribonuclease RuvC [Brackiella oedipodis]|uniref:crossover junction endodeoxyribonuclease RuvC n=1 Tax=Brackiella oedipodis TaxID=124225 RepID=UPI00048ECFEF|nr:crossover junction endodeoxyribonuclease RuvC [Brackiella oedipodis]
MKILAIDPGLRRTGYGIIAVEQNRLQYVTSGTIVVPTERSLAWRLQEIAQNINAIAHQYQPDVAAIEKVFVNNNPQSTLLLGHARGTAMCTLALLGLAVSEYTALQIKKSVVGKGHATKEQVQSMVQYLLKLQQAPSSDSGDALACAICHAHAAPLNQRLQGIGNFGHRASMRGGRVIN